MEEYEISERQIIGRDKQLFKLDIDAHENELADIVRTGRFLVIGGGGTIGQALALEIFKRDPKAMHIVDLSENNMGELVREIRSTVGYLNGEFKTFAIDCSSLEFAAMYKLCGPYDYIFNLSALKHVRGESDPFTLMRMINVNILNNINLI